MGWVIIVLVYIIGVILAAVGCSICSRGRDETEVDTIVTLSILWPFLLIVLTVSVPIGLLKKLIMRVSIKK